MDSAYATSMASDSASIPLEFRSVPLADEPARSLSAAMREEIAKIYTGVDLDGPDMPKAGPRELGPPGGVFLVGFEDSGAAVCCGGVKDLGDGRCEIKRMYVAPEARGGGRGRELLRALEQAARELGYEIARLDTGPSQPSARRMYVEAGYEEIENFNGNPVATFFGEKTL
jgi:GNAT superfamily N-acetyltransferase